MPSRRSDEDMSRHSAGFGNNDGYYSSNSQRQTRPNQDPSPRNNRSNIASSQSQKIFVCCSSCSRENWIDVAPAGYTEYTADVNQIPNDQAQYLCERCDTQKFSQGTTAVTYSATGTTQVGDELDAASVVAQASRPRHASDNDFSHRDVELLKSGRNIIGDIENEHVLQNINKAIVKRFPSAREVIEGTLQEELISLQWVKRTVRGYREAQPTLLMTCLTPICHIFLSETYIHQSRVFENLRKAGINYEIARAQYVKLNDQDEFYNLDDSEEIRNAAATFMVQAHLNDNEVNVCGKQIFCPKTGKSAVLGGYLLIGGKHLVGMTAGHFLSDERPAQKRGYDGHDSDDVSDVSSDGNLSTTNHQISGTYRDSIILSPTKIYKRSRHSTKRMQGMPASIEEIEDEATKTLMTIGQPLIENAVFDGGSYEVVASSYAQDYATIQMFDTPLAYGRNVFILHEKGGDRKISIEGYEEEPRDNRTYIVGPGGKAIPATVAPIQASILHSEERRWTKLFVIRPKKDASFMGYSGSWVVCHDGKSNTASVYGHVIGRHSNTPWLFVAPMVAVIEDIRRRLGTTDVRFPTEQDYQRFKRDESIPRYADVLSAAAVPLVPRQVHFADEFPTVNTRRGSLADVVVERPAPTPILKRSRTVEPGHVEHSTYTTPRHSYTTNFRPSTDSVPPRSYAPQLPPKKPLQSASRPAAAPNAYGQRSQEPARPSVQSQHSAPRPENAANTPRLRNDSLNPKDVIAAYNKHANYCPECWKTQDCNKRCYFVGDSSGTGANVGVLEEGAQVQEDLAKVFDMEAEKLRREYPQRYPAMTVLDFAEGLARNYIESLNKRLRDIESRLNRLKLSSVSSGQPGWSNRQATWSSQTDNHTTGTGMRYYANSRPRNGVSSGHPPQPSGEVPRSQANIGGPRGPPSRPPGGHRR